MGLDIKIEDGQGNRNFAEVTNDNELVVIASPYPPFHAQKVRPFRMYLTDDGTTSGSNDMGIDGSVTNVDFFIDASETDDRYITSLNVEVAYGTTGQPNEWADGTALTNGMKLFYISTLGEVVIHDAIKANQDFFRLGFTLIPTSWEVRHLGASNDFGYILPIDLTKLGLPYGIKLDAGTSQKLVITVRDNAGTLADTFNIIGYGFDRFE